MRLIELTAPELLDGFARRAFSPVEALQAVLAQIDRLDPRVNAFCALDREVGLEDARASEQRWARARPIGPLDGVPVSVKDVIPVRGMPTRFGSKTFPVDHLQQVDAPAVTLLRRAGAIVFGKTTTSEFANKIVTDSPLTGSTRNPWNLARSSGGSSGGAGAALASGMGPLALATDGGGSIRIPAGWNGVVGFKPSFKRIPSDDVDNLYELSCLGPMTRSVRDAALMLDVLARPWPADWQLHPSAGADHLEGVGAGVRGLKIALSADLGLADVEPDIAAAVDAAAQVLRSLGAVVRRLDEVPPLRGYLEKGTHSLHWIAALEAMVRAVDPAQRALIDPDVLELAEVGKHLPAHLLVDAGLSRLELTHGMHALLSEHDLLITPTFHCSAPPVPGLPQELRTAPPFTSWCNQTQQPAASIPCGLTSDGLPIGLQFVAARHRDDLVLRACRAYEAARGPFRLAPLATNAETAS